MSVKYKNIKDESEPRSVLDHMNALIDSPLRLFIFCVALLMISLTTGMLIGSVVKEDPAADQIAGNFPARPDLTLETESGSTTLSENQGTTIEGATENPVDALDHDNPYTISRTNGDDDTVSDIEVEDDVVASIPPADVLREGDSSQPPWKRYAALSSPSEGRPRIAMIIDDVGLNKGRVKALVKLPEILTLSFLPYATDLDKSANLTRTKGHEVMLHLPMEPLGATADPGPDALLEKLSLDEIRGATLKNLNQFSGYVGVNNHMGSKFTSYEEGMAVVMDVLLEKGLLFLDSRTTPTSKGYKLAKERGMPTATRDVFIDNEIDEAAILKQLKTVEAIASEKGIAIAIGHPHKETIAALNKWMPEAVKRGFHFIPLSAALSENIAD